MLLKFNKEDKIVNIEVLRVQQNYLSNILTKFTI